MTLSPLIQLDRKRTHLNNKLRSITQTTETETQIQIHKVIINLSEYI